MVYFYGTDIIQVLPFFYDDPYDYVYENDAEWQDVGGRTNAYVICERD